MSSNQLTASLNSLRITSTKAEEAFAAIMEGIQTHPSNAAQAKAFTAPGSLSFPGATNEISPPTGDMVQRSPNGQATNGNGVTLATPAATPAATQGASGITPTLQYVPF